MQNIRQPRLVLAHIEAVLFNKWRSRHLYPSYVNYLILQHEVTCIWYNSVGLWLKPIRQNCESSRVDSRGFRPRSKTCFENAVTHQWKFSIFKLLFIHLSHYSEFYIAVFSFFAAFSSRLVRTGSVSNSGSFTTVAGHLLPNSSTSTRDPTSVSSSGK